MQNIINVIATLIILVTLVAGVTFIVRRLYLSAQDAKLQAEIAIEDKAMEKHYEVTKSDYLNISDRLKVQVANHKFQWLDITINGKPKRYYRYADLKASEELTPQEVRDLDGCEAHLENVQAYREEKVNVPVGFIVHRELVLGEIIQWTPGVKRIGKRNTMAITVAENPDNTVRISDVHFSANFGVELVTTFNLADNDHFMAFQEYKAEKNIEEGLASELERFEEIKKQIEVYNLHAKHFVRHGAEVPMEYRYERRNTPNHSPKFEEAPEV